MKLANIFKRAMMVLMILAGSSLLAQTVSAENWVRVPEDYSKIEDAMAALAPEGGRVVIAPGEYAPVHYKINDLVFNDTAELILEADGGWVTFTRNFDFLDYYLKRLEFRGIHFQGNADYAAADIRIGTYTEPSVVMERELVLQNCRFDNSDANMNYSIWSQNIDRVRIQDCQFILHGISLACAIDVEGARDISITDCLFLREEVAPTGVDWPLVRTPTLIELQTPKEGGRIELTGSQYRGLSSDIPDGTIEDVAAVEIDAKGGELIIQGNDMPLATLDLGAVRLDTQVQIRGNRMQGMWLEDDYYDETGTGGSLTVEDNLFRQSISSNDAYGPFRASFPYDHHFRVNVQRNTFIKDTIFGGMNHMFLLETSRLIPASEVTIKNNNFMLPTDPDVYNDSGVAVSATGDLDMQNNYWGHGSGPDYGTYNEGTGVLLGANMNEGELLFEPFRGAPGPCGVESYLGDRLDISPTDAVQESESLMVDLEADRYYTTYPTTTTLEALVGGGVSPYEYHWFVDGRMVSTQNVTTLQWYFDTPDLHVVRLEVRDAEDALAGEGIFIDTRSPRAKILGSVFKKDLPDEIVEGARVALLDAAGKELVVRTTDNYGAVEFEDVGVGDYRLRAEAATYQRKELPVSVCSVKDRLRVRMDLALILDDEVLDFKEGLIDRLSAFPADSATGEPSDVARPYADVEFQALLWLDSQTELTQALQRLVTAEFAAYDASTQAVELAETAGTMTGALVRQVIEAVFSISYVKKYYESKIPAVFGIRQVLLNRLSSRSTMLISKWLKATGRILSSLEEYEMISTAMNGLLDNMLKSTSAGQNLYLNHHIKNLVSDKVKWSMLENYGARTAPYLSDALARATAGGPYLGNVEDADATVNRTLVAARRKTEIVQNAVGNIDAMNSYIASPVHTGLSVIGDVLAGSEHGACIKFLEMGYRSLESYGTYSNLSMLSESLRTTLPEDVRWATREAFGEIGFETTSLRTTALSDAPRLMKTAPVTPVLPSSTQLDAAVETCRAAVDASQMETFEAALSDLISAIDSFEAQSELILEQLELAGVEQGLQARANEAYLRFFMSGQTLMGACLDALITPNETTRLACLEKLVDYGWGVTRLLGELQRSLPAGSLDLPAAAVIENMFFTTDLAETATWITTSPQTLYLVVEVSNPSQLTAAEIDVTPVLSPETSLQLVSPAEWTQRIGTLTAGATAQLTWTLTYQGPLYGQPEYAQVSLAAATDPSVVVGSPLQTLLMTPWFPDGDEDGMDDRWEDTYGLDSTVDDSGGDLDLDGLSNRQEMIHQTHPGLADTDMDGASDGAEVLAGLDPTTSNVYEDQDGDGLDDIQEVALGTDPYLHDSDGDGASDGLEVGTGSDPDSADSTPDPNRLADVIRQRLVNGWRQPGTDGIYLDAYRDGWLDLQDLYAVRGATGEPTDELAFSVAFDQPTREVPHLRLPVHLYPAGEVSMLLMEFTVGLNQFQPLSARAGTGTTPGWLSMAPTRTGGLVMLVDTEPIAPLSDDPNVADLIIKAASDLAGLEVRMVRGQALDPAGTAFDLPAIELILGTYPVGGSSADLHWSIYD